MSEDRERFGEHAWRSASVLVPDFAEWVVLMDAAHGFNRPRQLVSDQDRYFTLEAVKAAYPRDAVSVLKLKGERFILRRPAPQPPGSDF